MSYRCENCQSLFFKTLETRLSGENEAILYKKRCKRCKYKYLIRKPATGGTVQTATPAEWAEGRKVNLASTTVCERGKVFIGEYSSRVSRPVEETFQYLNRIKAAVKEYADATPQNPC